MLTIEAPKMIVHTESLAPAMKAPKSCPEASYSAHAEAKRGNWLNGGEKDGGRC